MSENNNLSLDDIPIVEGEVSVVGHDTVLDNVEPSVPTVGIICIPLPLFMPSLAPQQHSTSMCMTNDNNLDPLPGVHIQSEVNIITKLPQLLMQHQGNGELDKATEIASIIKTETVIPGNLHNGGGSDWKDIVNRGIALKTLKRVQQGWGQGSISSLQSQSNNFLHYYDGSG
ncbi:hypothetical protein ACSQ67_021171 [Phaseolus vulgaris]